MQSPILKTIDEKYKTVIDKNTFYFSNRSFEQEYEGYLNSLKETLLVIRNEVINRGLQKDIFLDLLANNQNGLKALLALTGFSNESLKRLVTLIRVVDNNELARLTLKSAWCPPISIEEIGEWGDVTIEKMLRTNEHFRAGIVNLFFEGASIRFLAETLSLFELKKLGISKLQFDIPSLIDTLVRYKEKGSYSGKAANNPETVVAKLINDLNLTYEYGDLNELISNASATKRTMDFIIPNKQNPRIIVESSFLVTTSSGQGDKSKTEISIHQLLKQHYPHAIFVGFVDGIGWYVRKGDLRRMVKAYDDVFTFHSDELLRFRDLLIEEVK